MKMTIRKFINKLFCFHYKHGCYDNLIYSNEKPMTNMYKCPICGGLLAYKAGIFIK